MELVGVAVPADVEAMPRRWRTSSPRSSPGIGYDADTAPGALPRARSTPGAHARLGRARGGGDRARIVGECVGVVGRPRTAGRLTPCPRSTTGNSAARWTTPTRRRIPERQFAFVFNINRCIACQTCTMACKSTWTFSKGQEHMWWNNVETKPYGGYPQFWDVKILELLDQANPDGQGWDGAPADDAQAPYGRFEGKTIFEAAAHAHARQRAGPRLPAHRRGVEQRPTSTRTTRSASAASASSATRTGVELPEHKTWFFYLAAHLQPLHATRPAWPPARATPSTSGPRTASSSSTSSDAAATASASRPARTRSRCTGGNTRVSREVHRLLPARRRQGPGDRRACRWRRAAWPPASARSGCRGS